MLDKTYQPAQIEPRVSAEWERAQAFRAGRAERAAAQPYAIVIPPPNVTGALHMGHALNNTLQDVLCRFERMRGRDVLWQPGTDHAGIATQMVVERQLMERQEPDRRALGREEFVRRVWAWKEESGGAIVNQLKRLGASCDWSRERFTMDEGLSRAVVKVFVELYRAGLIYKDKRLVNWDPKFQTAISDLEVVQLEKRGTFSWVAGDPEKPFDAAALAKVLDTDPNGHLYYFRYPLREPIKGYDKEYIVVATTRPETMLGDTGVAVHPADQRYAALIEAKATVTLPLVGREIPIIADEYSDPEKGTGAVKITPAHDFNDFEVGKRHDLPQINILDAYGKVVASPFVERAKYPVIGHPNLLQGDPDGSTFGPATLDQVVPEILQLRGLDRFDARKKIVAQIAEAGLLEKIEPTTHMVPHGDRSGVAIEPWLTDQWYVNAAKLAKNAIKAVDSGKTKFIPANWKKTYDEWMCNIQPWCVSRQLWWGHQIPAWYGPDGKYFVADDKRAATEIAIAHYKKQRAGSGPLAHIDEFCENLKNGKEALIQDEDVLDTWFSSALWPFSTLGWPERTPELARYYPTNVLVTGFDIIFFWVARMMMMGLHFMKEVPFETVYIHALVRDEKGQKMSKSKGNVMDPLELIDRYGADALRFTLSAMAAQGRDIKLSPARVEGYRNFATKLWNAARFAEMNECVRQPDFDPASVEETLNRWIAGETERVSRAVTTAIESYRFNEAAGAVYEFVWGVFCDWYLELIKPILTGEDEAVKAETRATAAWALDQILKLLHPFMPFITEELWAHMVEHGVKRRSLLALSQWPEFAGLESREADEEIGWVVRVVSEIRSVRTEMRVPAGAKIPLVVVGADRAVRERVQAHEETIARLARLDRLSFVKIPPRGAALLVVDETTLALPLGEVIDMDAERRRLAKEIIEAEGDAAKMDAKLANPNFVARAKPEAVEEARDRKSDLEARARRLKAALARIDG